MNSELPTENDAPQAVFLKHERTLADRIAGAKSSTIDPEELEKRIAAILTEKPYVTFEAFRDLWRRHIREQLEAGRTFPQIWKSVVELDNTGREDLGSDIPVDQMYDRLSAAVMQLTKKSPAAVEKIIREVALEFRPQRNSR